MPKPTWPAFFDRAFIQRLLDIFPYVVVFLLSLTHPTDLDLGWHLKYGEHIFANHELLRTNTFSTSMPGYRYLNHSWGSELLLYTVFKYGGFFAISLLGASLMTMTFFFLARTANLDRWSTSLLFPAMLFLLDAVTRQSFRAHYFSFLGIAVLIYLLNRFEQYPRKTAVLLLLLFLIWANLHGQFIMGLGLFIIWLAFYYWRSILQKTTGRVVHLPPLYPATILLLSVAVTLINPYGIELYREIFRHIGNPLQRYILEWQPIYYIPELLMVFLIWNGLLLLSIIIGRLWKDLPANGHFLLPLFLFFIACFNQLRYFWPLIFLSVPAVSPLLKRLKPTNQNLAQIIACSVLGCVYLYAAVEHLPAQHLFNFNWGTYCRYNSLSPPSADFLKKIAPGHKLLNDYDLGGWLIWNYPEIKPAIDGRMPFWRDESGYSAYREYLGLEQGIADIDTSQYDLVYWSPNKAALYEQLTALAAAGKWRRLYDDPFAAIFVRNNGQAHWSSGEGF